jgi:hypothetical protein
VDYRYLRPRRDAKGKTVFSSDSKLVPDQTKKRAPVVAANMIVADGHPNCCCHACGPVFPHPRGVADIGLCAAKPSIFRHYSLPNVAGSFIDHSSEVWNFHADRMLIRCPSNEKGEAMRKTLMALAAVATLAVSAIAAPAPAHAQRGLGAAVAGGLIGGAIVGGAIASSPGYYGYGPGYYGPGYGYGGPAYVAAPGPGPGCYWQRQRFWDGYGWRFRRVQVCG